MSIDYSKWDKIAASSSSSSSDNADDDERDVAPQDLNNPINSSDQQQQPQPTVRKLNKPSAVTFGGGRADFDVIVKEPVAASSAAAAAAAAASAPSNTRQPEPAKPRLLRNGCLFTDCAGRRLFWSQTADTVQLGLVLEAFTLGDFLQQSAGQQQPQRFTRSDDDAAAEDPASSIDAAVRLWSTRRGARKVTRVDVASNQHATVHNDGAAAAAAVSGRRTAVVRVQTKGGASEAAASTETFELAHDAAPLDADEFWTVQLLSYNDLGLPSPAIAVSAASSSSPAHTAVVAVRALTVELRKAAQLATGVAHWWSELLSSASHDGPNAVGRINVETDVEDRRDGSDAKRAAMKQVWDDAHEMFRQRVAARKQQQQEDPL